jgi:integrase
MRRGEALALRWRDVDLDAGRLAVRRSLGVVKAEDAGERLVQGPTKTGQSRVVDLDAGTVAAQRAYRSARQEATSDLVRDSALVLSELDGGHRPPGALLPPLHRPAGPGPRGTGEEHLPMIRLLDLRHTLGILLLADGVPVKVVSERLGHASAAITLTADQHSRPATWPDDLAGKHEVPAEPPAPRREEQAEAGEQ